MKIIIETSGGIIHSIYASEPEEYVDIEIFDWDEEDSHESDFDKKITNLYLVY